MAKVKTNELIGAALDWAVAKADDNLHPKGYVLDGHLSKSLPHHPHTGNRVASNRVASKLGNEVEVPEELT